MTIIDPATNLGRLRLKISDWGDIPILPDSVYQQTLLDTNDNLQQSTVILGSYILGILSQRTHRKLAQMEVWSDAQFSQYLIYLNMIVKDPSFMGISPIPYSSAADFSPILDFQANWNKGFVQTEAQQLAFDADLSPNDNTRTGVYG